LLLLFTLQLSQFLVYCVSFISALRTVYIEIIAAPSASYAY